MKYLRCYLHFTSFHVNRCKKLEYSVGREFNLHINPLKLGEVESVRAVCDGCIPQKCICVYVRACALLLFLKGLLIPKTVHPLPIPPWSRNLENLMVAMFCYSVYVMRKYAVEVACNCIIFTANFL